MNTSIFSRFFSNLFDNARITDKRLSRFTKYVIAALTNANPGGVFTDLIADLTALDLAYFGNLAAHDQALADRKGGTAGLNAVIRQFSETVRSRYNLIAARYPVGTPEFLAFFPSGLSEYNNITRVNALLLATRFAAKADEYKAEFGGQPFATLFADLKTAMEAAQSLQNTDKAEVLETSGAIETSREPIENGLMKAMFEVGAHYWPNEETCRSYFDMSLLFAASHSGQNESGTVAANSITNCVDEGITESSTITLKNTGNVSLKFYLAASETATPTGTTLEVMPGQSQDVPYGGFASPGLFYLNVQNQNPSPGDWEVRVV